MGGALVILFVLSLPLLLLLLLIMMIRRRWKREAIIFKDNPLLPVWATASKSYALAWKYRMEFLRISWCWMAIGLPLLFLFNLMTGQSFVLCLNMHQSNAQLKAVADTHAGNDSFLSSLPDIAMLLIGVSIAVAWHRLILRNEKVGAKPYLRFDGLVWSYLIIVVFIGIIENAPQIIVGMLASGIEPVHGNNALVGILGILGAIIALIASYYAIRMTVMLPARALGITGVTIKEVLRRTKYNFWRISWGHLLCVLPSCLLFLLLLFPLQPFCDNIIASSFFYTFDFSLTMIVLTPVYLSFLSLSYRHFFEGGLKQEERL